MKKLPLLVCIIILSAILYYRDTEGCPAGSYAFKSLMSKIH